MAEAAKCAHPPCECLIIERGEYGKYCSEHCKKAGQITELRCACPHPECRHPAAAPPPVGSRPAI
jgi:hypothetical protein